MRSANELRIQSLERQSDKMNHQNRSEAEKNNRIALIEKFVGRPVSGLEDLALEELLRLKKLLLDAMSGSKT